jgi:hypothetical protein
MDYHGYCEFCNKKKKLLIHKEEYICEECLKLMKKVLNQKKEPTKIKQKKNFLKKNEETPNVRLDDEWLKLKNFLYNKKLKELNDRLFINVKKYLNDKESKELKEKSMAWEKRLIIGSKDLDFKRSSEIIKYIEENEPYKSIVRMKRKSVYSLIFKLIFQKKNKSLILEEILVRYK